MTMACSAPVSAAELDWDRNGMRVVNVENHEPNTKDSAESTLKSTVLQTAAHASRSTNKTSL